MRLLVHLFVRTPSDSACTTATTTTMTSAATTTTENVESNEKSKCGYRKIPFQFSFWWCFYLTLSRRHPRRGSFKTPNRKKNFVCVMCVSRNSSTIPWVAATFTLKHKTINWHMYQRLKVKNDVTRSTQIQTTPYQKSAKTFLNTPGKAHSSHDRPLSFNFAPGNHNMAFTHLSLAPKSSMLLNQRHAACLSPW